MGSWVGQYCIYVSDLERTIAFYETLGLQCTSRTDIPNVKEAIVENPDQGGGKIQLAEKLDSDDAIDMGNALWKLYINTDNCQGLHETAVGAGYQSVMEPTRLERWPVTVAFLADPDGYQVELVQRHDD